MRLSHPQQRILISHLKYKDKPLCNIGGYVFIDKMVDFEKLKKAIEKTLLSMDCFSISINSENGYSQTFDRKDVCVEVINEPHGTEENLAKIAQEIINNPFNLEAQYYYKTCVWSGENCSGFVFVGHHIVCDGWTFQMLAEAISANYRDENFLANSYADFIKSEDRYLQSEQAKRDEKYWNSFITDNVCDTNISSSRTCNGWREEYRFTKEEQENIIQIEKAGISLNTILCAFFSIMSKKEYRTNIIGIPCFNRVGKKQKSTGGMFTSTMLSAASFDNEKTLMDNLSCYQKELKESFRYQKWPFEYIQLNRNSETFMFSVNCYNTSMTYGYGDAAKGYCHELHPGYQMLPAQIILNRWENNWLLQFDFMEDFFNKGDSEKYIFYFREFIDGINNNRNQAEFDKKCIDKINKIQHQTEKIDGLVDISLHERISRIFSDEYSDRILFILNDRDVLGREFVEYIKGAVNDFNSVGLEAGDSAVVWMRNSLEYIVYIYACVVTGIRFIPTDISTPEERVCYLYENSHSKVVITDTEKNHNFKNYIKPVLKKCESDFLPTTLSENEQLYMVYTSGSTGMPKGVMISRHSMATYLNWAEAYYGDELSFYLHSSPSFDLSLTIVFLPLTSKGKIVIDQYNNSPLYRLSDLELASKVNAVKATPTHLSLMVNGNAKKLNLRVIICGGEDLTISLADHLQDIFGDTCNIYNEYGPTECTIGCMCSKHERGSKNKSVSIGIASPGTNVFVVKSENNRFCSPGESGEIYLAGEQVALGYWNLPKENEEHFLHNLFGCKDIYRTGDWARYSLDGRMEFLGRIGRQTKVNGYRIELDSVENTLKNINGIKNAATWVEKGTPDYLIAVAETLELSEDEIREKLKEKLPIYGIPHYIYIIDRIPETVNGKVDIEFLKEKIFDDVNRRIVEKSVHFTVGIQSNVSTVLEKVLRGMFNYDGNIDDFDFIIHGGDSIQAIQLTARLKAEGYNISLMDILDNSKFSDMVSCIKSEQIYSEKKEYKLPANLRYFSETCDEFSEYYHEIHVVLSEEISEEKVKLLEEKLIEVFPGLKCTLNGDVVSYNDTSNHEFFDLRYIYENNEYKLCIRMHHVLVDGVAWIEILNAISKLLKNQECQKRFLPENWIFDEKVSYEWSNSNWTANSGLVEYKFCTKADNYIDAVIFTEKIINVLSAMDKEYKYLLDCDSRTMLEVSQPDNIGCYSFLVPVSGNTNISIASQLETIRKSKEVRIPEGNLVRISYLGDFDKIIPKDFTFIEKSLEISRMNCSAWNCEFEITAYINQGMLNIIIGSRLTDNIKKLKLICEKILDELLSDMNDIELDIDDLDIF